MNSGPQQLLEHYPLEKLVQIVPAGLFLVNLDQEIVYWSEEAERITGYSAAEVVGRSCMQMHSDPCCYDCSLFDGRLDKPLIGQACSFVHKDGRRLSLTKNIDLLHDSAGTIIGGIEAFVDRTGYEEVELERNSLRSVLNGMNDPVYICDRQYRLLFFNRAMEKLIGKMTDHPCYQVLYGRDDPCPDCPMDEVFQRQLCCQETQLAGTGRTYEVLHSACHFQGQPESKLGVCRDITERLAIRHRLQRVNRELDAFVSMVSHDLRSPLTPLIGFAELLRERYSGVLDDLGRESLQEICTTAEKMKDLLEDLLCLARVGQLPVPDQPVATARIVEDVLSELADQVEQCAAQVEVGFLPDVLIPESLLTDMYRNLLSNALKYGMSCANSRIEVFGQAFAGRIELLVRDYGAGVVAAERGTIFEPFVRGHAAHKNSGTGIGLATVAKIAQVYRGTVWVEETPGGGATFVVQLPDVDSEF